MFFTNLKHSNNLRVFVIYIAITILSPISYADTKISQIADSIEIYYNYSKNKDRFSLNERLNYATKAKNLALTLADEPSIIKCNKRLSTVYWKLSDYENFKEVNIQNTKYAKKRDSLALGKAKYNLGLYYNKATQINKAYQHFNDAKIIFKKLNDHFNYVLSLIEIADIHKNEKDFSGSEYLSIEALKIANTLEESNDASKLRAYIYTNLGLVSNQLEEFDKAIEYHKKALEIKKEAKESKRLVNNTLNNLALAYKTKGEYKVADFYYNKLLNDVEFLSNIPSFHALVLDNYAHTQYLSKNFKNLPGLYLKALKISDNSGAKYNSIIINFHLAEYYENSFQKDSALYYAYQSKALAEQFYKEDILKSLKLLAEIETDSIAVKHYRTYIKYSDSIQLEERRTRNKFARIAYETEEIVQKNKQISKERQWLLLISIALGIALILIYIIITQRAKNKQLLLKEQQQKANEEIYNLMLTQNTKLDEVRAIEKQRIAQELHDGILSRLFGTRLNLDSINFVLGEDIAKKRAHYINQLRSIEKDIRQVSHDLHTDFVADQSFVNLISTLIENQTQIYQISYSFENDFDIDWEIVPNKTKIHVYRILQESLLNIHKHAKASHVYVSFKRIYELIYLTIKDDGQGFSISKRKKGIGIRNIESRVKEINGKVTIESIIKKGTTITIQFPFIIN